MSPDALRSLLAAVQTNCDITDARFAADLPLCIYLLQLREFYRWEHGLAFGAPLPRAALGDWLARREAHWDTLAGRALVKVPCPGKAVDPFDVARIDAALQPLGLGYGAGLLGPGRPVFFVAERQPAGPLQLDGRPVPVRMFGHELARGLLAPLALLAEGDTIVLRQAALARWLWEQVEARSLHPADGPFGRFATACGVPSADAFNAGLPTLLQTARPVLLLHELGELRSGRWLGPRWAPLREALADDRRSELRLLAVRDHLADLGTTLPALLAEGASAPLHFWFAGYEGHREALFPGLKPAYAAWCSGDGGRALQAAMQAGETHFRQLAERLLALPDAVETTLAQALAQQLNDPSAPCTA